MADEERWTLDRDGRTHVVVVEPAGWGRRIMWTLDGEAVAGRRTNDDRVTLPDGTGTTGCALLLRFPWAGPARRVTLFEDDGGLDAAARAAIGVGGTDLDPAPGSRAARRDEWIRGHPRLYTAQRTAAATLAVVAPLLLAWLLARLAFSLPWPDWQLPSIPWPTIPWPSIPWPTIPWPSIPWPTIPWPSIPWPDVTLPAWVEEVLSRARYVVPVLVAAVLAHREVRRRRDREARRHRAEDARREPG